MTFVGKPEITKQDVLDVITKAGGSIRYNALWNELYDLHAGQSGAAQAGVLVNGMANDGEIHFDFDSMMFSLPTKPEIQVEDQLFMVVGKVCPDVTLWEPHWRDDFRLVKAANAQEAQKKWENFWESEIEKPMFFRKKDSGINVHAFRVISINPVLV